jgi:hypothetical protein
LQIVRTVDPLGGVSVVWTQKVAVIGNGQVAGVFRTFVVGALGVDFEFGMANQSVLFVRFDVLGPGVFGVVVG